MIFLTVGTQKFQFDRLLESVDKYIEKGVINEPVIAQTGYSEYKPHNYDYVDFMDSKDFLDSIDLSSLIISHGGTGAIITALKMKKKLIAIPRDMKHDEHVDNHQFEIVSVFDELNYIEACYDTNTLDEAIRKIRKKEMSIYTSSTSEIIKDVELVISNFFE